MIEASTVARTLKIGPKAPLGESMICSRVNFRRSIVHGLSAALKAGGGGLLLLWMAGVAAGQEFLQPLVPEPDEQFGGVFLSEWDAGQDGEGFLFGLGAMGSYDSNVYLDDSDEVSDFASSLNPWVRFSSAPSGGALWIAKASYVPVIRRYWEQDSLDAVDQSGDVSLSYEGAVTRFSSSARYSTSTLANRFEGGQSETEQLSFRAEGSHTLSNLTSLRMGISHSDSQTSQLTTGGGSSDTQSTVASFSVLWEATPLMKIGPTLRGSQRSSGTLDDTEAVGLLLTMDYELSGLTQLRASAGAEQITGDSGSGSELRFTGGITLDYQAPDLPWTLSADLQYGEVSVGGGGGQYGEGGDSPFSGSVRLAYNFADRWIMQGSVRYGSFPSPGGASYSVNDLGGALSVRRELGQGFLQLGVSLGTSEYDTVDGAAPREDDQNFAVFVTHRMLIFNDRSALDSSIRFSESEGSRDWSRSLLSVGLNHTF